jgi:hypothetical protein
MSFSSQGFSYKVFNAAISIHEYMSYVLFPQWVFKEGILRHNILPPSQRGFRDIYIVLWDLAVLRLSK